MKVFGIGMNKTGTKSLGTCLEHWGFRHTSYDLNLTRDVAQGKFASVFRVADEYDSFEDWPWPLVYRELDIRYPDSRFILTTRSSSEVWFNSLVKHAARTETSEFRELIFGYARPTDNPAHHILFYERHNHGVREYFKDRPHRLLEVCWEAGDGWPQLCRFLERDAPDMPFPHVNQAATVVRAPAWRTWKDAVVNRFGRAKG